MTRLSPFIFLLVAVSFANAQPATIEVMPGEKNYFYQHTLSKSISNSRFGFFHTSSLHAFYTTESLNELMSQSYLTIELTKFIKLALGTFYASKPGISGAAALQLAYTYRNFRAALVPRVDLKASGSVEMMMLFEYSPDITQHMKFYLRAQFMTNYGSYHHNRSYQNFRAGLRVKNTLVGIALNIDERGREINTLYNLGVFLRYDLN